VITDPAELAAQKRITTDFINRDFELITLTPRTQTRTSTGGYVFTPGTPRAPQKFHVIERVSNAMPRTRVVGGDQRIEDFTLLGNWDAVVEPHDIFTMDGAEWEIVSVARDNGYERRATVIRFGA
jgi:hypothetical protein